MQRKFATNLALCATIYQATALRLLDQDIEEFVYGIDGQQLTIVPQEDEFITLAQQQVSHGCTYVMD
jgi:hypothetical protein